MDNKGVFPSLPKRRLVKTMNVKEMDEDIIQWTERVVSERMVQMIIEGRTME
jgi:hypothetical protein